MPNVHLAQGGQTRALLARNRIFAEHGGVDPSVLLFVPAPDLEERRAALLEAGLTTDRISLLSIFEHYRERGWRDEHQAGRPLRDLSRHKVAEELLPDGTPWRTTYQLPGQQRTLRDYHRLDGSVYLRIPSFVLDDFRSWPRRIHRVTPEHEVSGTYERLGQWFRSWVRELAEEAERTFLFLDARQMVPHLVPMPEPDIHVVYVLHNNHLQPPRRWDSPTTAEYERVLNRVAGLDALVCLTERQREDIGRRRGATSNLFVVPHPVALPAEPEGASRDPRQVTMLARLEPQKRLGHALRAFELVVRQVPDAKLDVFGAGHLREQLQSEIDRRRLGGSVTLRGHDPGAADSLWTSSASLLTSTHEGYALVIMESLAHGCPVVAYDVSYGPREQLTDGIDGFLVEDGRVAVVAERVVRLLRDPQLVARMGEAARAKAAEHGVDRFVSDWAAVLSTCVEAASRRTVVRETRLTLRSLAVGGRRRRRVKRGVASAGRYGVDQLLELDGTLEVNGRGPGGLHDASLELLAVGRLSGEQLRLPLEVRPRRDRLEFHTAVRLADAFPASAPDQETMRLQLRLVWRNSAADHLLVPRGSTAASVQLAYEPDGAVVLTRFAPDSP